MNSICSTCGTQFADTPQPPVHCPVCEDERQYVGLAGQTWTTLNELRDKYKTKLEQEEDRLLSFSIDPHFAIGQHAFLVQTAEGNLLWDCLSLMDQETVNLIHANGGLDAIAISHPHYYASMVEWSQEFGNVPVYLHADDAQWVMRPDACIQFWHGDTKEIWSGLTLIRSGGHFAGGTVLHWNAGAERKGALLTGDIIQVVPDRCHVSFMYSFPNYIPLDASAVERIVASVEPFEWDRLYGAFPGLTIQNNGKQVLYRSAERYISAIRGTFT